MADESGKKKTRFPGVRLRKHSSRKHGVKFDECYFIRHRVEGKLVEEQVGWLSQGITAEKAYSLLGEFKENKRTGAGPQSLQQMRAVNKRLKEDAEMQRLLDQSRAISFGEYFREKYLPEASQRKKPKSLSVEAGHLRDWLEPVFADLPMRDIGRTELEQVKDRLFAAGRSPRTMQHALAVFRLVWNHAKKRGVVEREAPTATIDMPKVENARVRFLTPHEANDLLEAIKAIDNQAWRLTLAALYTGARLGELASLRWSRVDLKADTIQFMHTKTGKPRMVPIAGPLKRVLLDCWTDNPTALVFTRSDGGAWNEQPGAFRRAVRELGLNEGRTDRRELVVFHSLRHTAASMMLAAGCDIRSLQSLFGWSTLQMAQRYTHAVDEVKKRAVTMLENVLSPSNAGKVVPLQMRHVCK